MYTAVPGIGVVSGLVCPLPIHSLGHRDRDRDRERQRERERERLRERERERERERRGTMKY